MEPNIHALNRHIAIQEEFDTLLCSEYPTVDEVYALVWNALMYAKEVSSPAKKALYLRCADNARMIARYLDGGGTFDADLLWDYATCVYDIRG